MVDAVLAIGAGRKIPAPSANEEEELEEIRKRMTSSTLVIATTEKARSAALKRSSIVMLRHAATKGANGFAQNTAQIIQHELPPDPPEVEEEEIVGFRRSKYGYQPSAPTALTPSQAHAAHAASTADLTSWGATAAEAEAIIEQEVEEEEEEEDPVDEELDEGDEATPEIEVVQFDIKGQDMDSVLLEYQSYLSDLRPPVRLLCFLFFGNLISVIAFIL